MQISVKAGLPVGPYGVIAKIVYWGHSTAGSVTAYDDRYVWDVFSWLDSPDSNPRRYNYAIIDPLSGEAYTVLQGSGSWSEVVLFP